MIETDASGNGIGADFIQQGRPLINQALSKKAKVNSLHEQDLMAMGHAVQRWPQYLLGHHFIIPTDQLSLIFLVEQEVGLGAEMGK